MPSKALHFVELRGGRPVVVPRLQFGIKLGVLRKAAVWYSVVGLLAFMIADVIA